MTLFVETSFFCSPWMSVILHSVHIQIINKARGKSGPLFNFDVHDDVRMLADATVEKDEVCNIAQAIFFFLNHADSSLVIAFSHTRARLSSALGTTGPNTSFPLRAGRSITPKWTMGPTESTKMYFTRAVR
jgi:hypothetical protein